MKHKKDEKKKVLEEQLKLINTEKSQVDKDVQVIILLLLRQLRQTSLVSLEKSSVVRTVWDFWGNWVRLVSAYIRRGVQNVSNILLPTKQSALHATGLRKVP